MAGPGKRGPEYKLDWEVWMPRIIRMLESGDWQVRELANEIGVSKNCLVMHITEYRRRYPKRKFWWLGIKPIKEQVKG